MNFLNADQIESRDIYSEVCVIGSGPAGGVLASKLSQKKIDTLLIEAGSLNENYNSNPINKFNGSSSIKLNHIAFDSKFGGSSNLWAGRSTPLEDIDFKNRNWIPNSGWPLQCNSLKFYYRNASNIINLPSYDNFYNKYNIFSIIKENESLKKDKHFDFKCMQWANTPFKVSDYINNNNSKNLRILLNAPVSKLIEKNHNDQVDYALIITPNDKKIKVYSKFFVVAAGGIETTRLLFNSDKKNSYGIGNHFDILGRYFSTHPKADLAILKFNKSFVINPPIFKDLILNNGRLRYGIGLNDYYQEKYRLLNHLIHLSPIYDFKSNYIYEIIFRKINHHNKLLDRDKFVNNFFHGFKSISEELINRIFKRKSLVNKFICRGFLDQFPNSENRIYRSNKKDFLNNNLININWNFSQKDRNSVISFFNHLDYLFNKKNIGKFFYSNLEKYENWPLVNIHSHFMGSTRMGINPNTSYTDLNCKVHNVDNLYICGPSVFPTFGFANPFLTIIALSLRLNDHLQKKFNQR